MNNLFKNMFEINFWFIKATPICRDGWFLLIWKLCEDIKKLNPPSTFETTQIKEKFGGLRFYVTEETDEIHKLISIAESASFKICDICGRDGTIIQEACVRTRCTEHGETVSTVIKINSDFPFLNINTNKY